MVNEEELRLRCCCSWCPRWSVNEEDKEGKEGKEDEEGKESKEDEEDEEDEEGKEDAERSCEDRLGKTIKNKLDR